jgi:hypothetical protein
MLTFKFRYIRSNKAFIHRRQSSPEKPSWATLSAKIEESFLIPRDDVGLFYTDADKDFILMSTEEELADYYRSASFGGGGRVMLLTIMDLSILRKEVYNIRKSTTEHLPNKDDCE